MRKKPKQLFLQCLWVSNSNEVKSKLKNKYCDDYQNMWWHYIFFFLLTFEASCNIAICPWCTWMLESILPKNLKRNQAENLFINTTLLHVIHCIIIIIMNMIKIIMIIWAYFTMVALQDINICSSRGHILCICNY